MKVASFERVVAIPLLIVLAAPGQTQGSVQDLGFLPGGNASFAYGVNADGSVAVGWSLDAIGYEHAFRWVSGTGMQDLGTLGGAESFAYGVSAQGSVVAGESTDALGYYRAFRWTAANGMQDLGNFPGGDEADAYAVNGDGSVVVGESNDGTGLYRAFRWTTTSGMQDLGTLGGSESFAQGVSADGTVVVGGSHNASGQNHAFRWTAMSGMQDLGTLGGSRSEAAGASADGSVVVGGSLTAGGDWRAFRWTAATGMQSIGTLSGATASFAWGVNADGSVVTGDSVGAFRWTATTGMQPIGTVSTIIAAFGVNVDGSVAVGGAFNGNYRAVRWDSNEVGSRYCTPVANSTGRSALLVVSGSNVVVANSLQLATEFLPNGSWGFFLTSTAQGNIGQPGGSQGVLCLGGSIGRYVGAGQIKNSGTTGSFSLAIDLTSMPQPQGSVAVSPGDTWNFQTWHRDAIGGVATSNFTDAVAVTFF